MIKPSNSLLEHLSTLALHLFHQVYIDKDCAIPGSNARSSQWESCAHTALVKIQFWNKWVTASGSCLQSLQIGSLLQPLFWRFSAVKILLCSKVHAKKRHFGSIFAFQIGNRLHLVYPNLNYCNIVLLSVPPRTNMILVWPASWIIRLSRRPRPGGKTIYVHVFRPSNREGLNPFPFYSLVASLDKRTPLAAAAAAAETPPLT